MIILQIHNDAKEKRQSFEAHCKDLDVHKGYGRTKDEAIEEFKENLSSCLSIMKCAHSDLYSNTYETVNVDCMGVEIK